MKELRTEYGVMFNDGSIRTGYNGKTARLRAALDAKQLRRQLAPDNIRLVSRPVYAGDWTEEVTA